MDWKSIVLAILGSAGVGGIIVAAVRKVVERALKAQNIKLKAELDEQRDHLRHTLEKQKAVFDAAIGKQAFEHQTVYPRLHKKSMEVVTQSYMHLSKFIEAVTIYTRLFRENGSKTYSEELATVVERFEPFKEYFFSYKIFLPETSANEIEANVQQLVSTVNYWKYMVHMKRDEHVDWQAVNTHVEKTPAIIKELEHSYRKLVRIEVVFPSDEGGGQ